MPKHRPFPTNRFYEKSRLEYITRKTWWKYFVFRRQSRRHVEICRLKPHQTSRVGVYKKVNSISCTSLRCISYAVRVFNVLLFQSEIIGYLRYIAIGVFDYMRIYSGFCPQFVTCVWNTLLKAMKLKKVRNLLVDFCPTWIKRPLPSSAMLQADSDVLDTV